MDKIFLAVSFEQKNEAKKLGAKFCGSAKLWYIPSDLDEDNSNELLDKFGRALENNIFIKVPYDDRSNVKKLGCKWNPSKKKWYIPRNINKQTIEILLKKYESM